MSKEPLAQETPVARETPVASQIRPEGRRPSGKQTWKHLLFAHYPLDPEEVRATVPAELELDLYDDRAWIGCVPFEMEDVLLRGMPRLFGMDFLETNLRTYVRYRGEPGVYFYSLEAASRLAVTAARIGWALPYHYASMRTENAATDEGRRFQYRTERAAGGALLEATFEVGEELGPSPVGSFDAFLLERYDLFSKRGEQILKGHVHHVPYPRRAVRLEHFRTTLGGPVGLKLPNAPPPVVHFSDGVEVDVYGPWRV